MFSEESRSGIELLRESRISHSVILMNVLKEYSKDENTIFWFFEGMDAAYFGPRIWQVFAEHTGRVGLSFKNCFGKENILRLIELADANESLKEALLVYFVDRDFDWSVEGLDSTKVYVTEGYSIESYYASADTFKKILQNSIFNNVVYTDADAACLARIMELFLETQEKFHSQIQLFNLWAYSQRHLVSGRQINLSSIDDVDLVQISLSDVRRCYDLTSLNEKYPTRHPVTEEHLTVARRWFEGKDPRLTFRGKQEIQFVARILNLLRDLATAGRHPFHRKMKCSLRFSARDLIGDLSGYADTPSSLMQFIAHQQQKWVRRTGGAPVSHGSGLT